MTHPKPVVLCILDGWGYREDRTANAPALADTPTFDRLWSTCPHAFLVTYGPDVGLPTGQMGNSEVGHTNIGAVQRQSVVHPVTHHHHSTSCCLFLRHQFRLPFRKHLGLICVETQLFGYIRSNSFAIAGQQNQTLRTKRP